MSNLVLLTETAGCFDLSRADECSLTEYVLADLNKIERGWFLKGLRTTLRSPPALVRQLADYWDSVGFRRRSSALRIQMLSSGEFSIDDLVRLANIPDAVNDETYHPPFPEASWQQEFSDFGRLRVLTQVGDKGESLVGLSQLSQHFPDEPEIQAVYGKLLFDLGCTAEYSAWRKLVSQQSVGESPDLLFAVSLNFDREESAEPCWQNLIRVLKLDPEHLLATQLIARILRDAGQISTAELMGRRASAIAEYRDVLAQMYEQGPDINRLVRSHELASVLGRELEVAAWSAACKANNVPPERLKTVVPSPIHLTRWRIEVIEQLPLRYPSPKSSDGPPKLQIEMAGKATPQFAEVSDLVGLDWIFQTGTDFSKPGIHITQTMAAGVGAIDYDLDGWEDIILPQGGDAGHGLPVISRSDGLARNLTGRFKDIAENAGYNDDGYSQGVAVGDVNSDGFPDIYSACLGTNRLFVNQGDGTFSQADCGRRIRPYWTASCAIADLNGDGHPDLLDVTYTEEISWSKLCGEAEPRSCVPTGFRGETDAVWMSHGDGTWTGVEIGETPPLRPGRGLGTVVSKWFTGDFRPAAFVANDMEANELLVFRSSTPKAITPESQQLFSGVDDLSLEKNLAFDGDGRAQACMGVAVADVNRDDLDDIYVTNFLREYNTLYIQGPPGEFTDRTREFRLVEPTLPMLGFGTQFLDVDHDGFPDIYVANGHVEDFPERKLPFRMRGQLFVNRGGIRFEPADPKETGKYFEEEVLGRGVAVLDFNRDGKEDLVIGHLGRRFALLKNETVSRNCWIGIQPIGTLTNRDAFGASVSVRTSSQTFTKRVDAGGGFMAANHRWLIFGLGDATAIESVEVTWDTGVREVFGPIPVNQYARLIEGRGRAFVVSQ